MTVQPSHSAVHTIYLHPHASIDPRIRQRYVLFSSQNLDGTIYVVYHRAATENLKFTVSSVTLCETSLMMRQAPSHQTRFISFSHQQRPRAFITQLFNAFTVSFGPSGEHKRIGLRCQADGRMIKRRNNAGESSHDNALLFAASVVFQLWQVIGMAP
jgi:hypothetical protein